LVLITGTIANQLTATPLLRVIIGASLMILIDFPLEVISPIFDFWEFSGGVAPLQNYLAWFAIAAGLHGFFQWGKIQEDVNYAYHLYAAQLVFFAYFALFYSV
ncbi:MAG: carotenoid biosynthesis protein, partial [Bacteroidota bacterium]